MKKIIHDNILVGSDPEVFLFDKVTEKFVSAIDKLGGTKDFPMPLGRDGFFVQEDNVLGEFNIPPAATKDEFVGNILTGLSLLRGRLPGEHLDLKIQASAFMPEESLQDPRALMFGCDPDYNAWRNGKMNPAPPLELKKSPLRSAGGHLLAGYTLTDEEVDKEAVDQNIIRWCDLYLGVPSVIMDKDTERKKLYGKAGAYRSKSFGVEYRTLSSFWLGSEKTIAWAYKNFVKAVQKAGNSEFIPTSAAPRIQAAINKANVEIAYDLVKEFDLEVV